MRALPALLAGLLLLVGACASERSQADQDHDAGAVLAALRGADRAGADFTMDVMLVETGGSIAKGKEALIHASVAGSVKSGRARFTFKVLNSKATYTMVFADGQIYVKGASAQGWSTTSAAGTTPLYAPVRLSLVTEAVKLERSISASKLERLDAGVTRHYTVMPREHQLEQLQAMSPSGPAEQAFLKSASASLDFYLSAPGDHLMRVGVHTTGTDPAGGVKQKVDSVADFKLSGKVAAIDVPSDAVTVGPDQILNSK